MIEVYKSTNTNFDFNGDMVLKPSLCDLEVELNGMIEVTDAVLVLTYYAKSAAGIAVTIDSKSADVNQDGIVDVVDAVGILTYYARQAAGLPPTF